MPFWVSSILYWCCRSAASAFFVLSRPPAAAAALPASALTLCPWRGVASLWSSGSPTSRLFSLTEPASLSGFRLVSCGGSWVWAWTRPSGTLSPFLREISQHCFFCLTWIPVSKWRCTTRSLCWRCVIHPPLSEFAGICRLWENFSTIYCQPMRTCGQVVVCMWWCRTFLRCTSSFYHASPATRS